jgi:hypothetical protein
VQSATFFFQIEASSTSSFRLTISKLEELGSLWKVTSLTLYSSCCLNPEKMLPSGPITAEVCQPAVTLKPSSSCLLNPNGRSHPFLSLPYLIFSTHKTCYPWGFLLRSFQRCCPCRNINANQPHLGLHAYFWHILVETVQVQLPSCEEGTVEKIEALKLLLCIPHTNQSF